MAILSANLRHLGQCQGHYCKKIVGRHNTTTDENIQQRPYPNI